VIAPPRHGRANARIAPWIRPYILDLGCCGAVASRLGAPGHGLHGCEGSGFDLDLDHANVLVVAGRIPPDLASVLRGWHARVAAPRWTIAFGDCALSGAVYDTMPARDVIPVDIEVPGCPPPVDALRDALAALARRRQS
jgi:NADH:ubiquinone oxidoreductase subunit B-like Fe-S oxidoreductase